MILSFIESIGGRTITFISSIYALLEFSVICFFYMLVPSNYSHQVLHALFHQVYYTSITSLSLFSLIAFFFGSIVLGLIISIATNYGLELQLGSIIVDFVINDFSPIFTALFIALRFSSRISKKFSCIHIPAHDNEIFQMILPRVLNGILSTLSLSTLFSFIVISSAYLSIHLFVGMDFHSYKYILFDALRLENIIIWFFKSITFGFIIMIVPIFEGLRAQETLKRKKITQTHTLVKLFFAIFFTELVSLLFLALLDL